MTALELLTVVFAVLCLGAAVVLTVLCGRVFAVARRISDAAETLEREAIPAVEELRSLVAATEADLQQLGDVAEVASAIGARVDSASEATYRALTTPVIKGVALATGTRRVAQRLRGGSMEARSGHARAHGSREGNS